MTCLVCLGGHCVIVSVRGMSAYMMFVGVCHGFCRLFSSQFERGRRDVQRAMQGDSRNHAAVARPALSSISGAESDQME